VGDQDSNRVLARIADWLPVKGTAEEGVVAAERFAAATHATIPSCVPHRVSELLISHGDFGLTRKMTRPNIRTERRACAERRQNGNWAMPPLQLPIFPTGGLQSHSPSEGSTPIQCANSVPTRPEAAKLAHAQEKNASMQAHDSEVLIDGMDKPARGGKYPGKDS
jgi:hypothetical protein